MKSSARLRFGMLAALMLIGLVSSACLQQSNTYPIEIFKEMHYAQFQRSQEPPRILPPASSVAFSSVGGPETVLDVPAIRERAYDPAVAGELYRVNCSMCHGINGDGNGPAARHIASPDSYWSTTVGTAYAAPASLLDSRARLTSEAAFSIINNGVIVMPRFGKLMSEEDIRDIVAYVFDTETGLGSGR